MRVAREVRGDAEQRVAPVRFVLVDRVGPKEAIVGVLQEVIGQLPVAGHARQIGPQRTRRAVIEGAERLLVHLKDDVRVGAERLEPLDVCQ